MPFVYPEIRTLHGLNLQRNTFTVPEGSCEQANNIVVKQDNMITSRRGYYQYFTPLAGIYNKLINFQSYLLAIYTNKMSYYTNSGTTVAGVAYTTSSSNPWIIAVVSTAHGLTTGDYITVFDDSNLVIAGIFPVTVVDANDFTFAEYIANPGSSGTLSYALDPSPNQVGIETLISAYGDSKAYISTGAGPYVITVTSNTHGLQIGQTIIVSGATHAVANGTFSVASVPTNNIFTYSENSGNPSSGTLNWQLQGDTISISGTSRNIQANGNLYFTTDDGVLKLPAYNGMVSNSGAPPGLDLGLNYVIGQTANWFTPGNIVGYRGLFGYSDANNNLILGAPSQVVQFTNPIVSGVAYTSTGSGPYTITVTSTAHGLTTGIYLIFSSGTSANADGTYQITVTGSNTFTYSENAGSPSTGTVSYAYAAPINIQMSIPSDINTTLLWFYQIYRTSQQTIATGNFDDFQLINQSYLTAAQITAGTAFFLDNIPDILLSTFLYTNENSGEGESQANNQAPQCQDMTYFKNYAMYANCATRQFLNVAVINPLAMSAADYVEIQIGAVTRRYVAQTGVANQTVIGAVSSSAGNLLITYAVHGLANGTTIYISNIIGGTLTAGTYYVINTATNTFEISTSSGGSAVSYNSESSLYFEGVTNGTYPIFFLSSNADAAVRLQQTAVAIVKATNRDPSSIVYGQYVSLINQVPGQMMFTAKGFTGIIYMRADSTNAGAAFSPALPATFSTVFSTNLAQPNAIYISKLNEPEAVPLSNFLPAGATNFPILRIEALRDSVIIVKTDGVFRLVGDNVDNFTITILDGTIFCVANSSLDLLNNQVVFLSNQGICRVSESSVEIISREKIEPLIQPILGLPDLGSYTSGLGYETERLYLLTTTLPNNDVPQVTYAYDILTNEWTTWDILMAQGLIGPSDLMYFIGVDNNLYVERKNQTKIDYSDQDFIVTIVSISGSIAPTAVITSIGYIPKLGDMILKDNVITWIITDPLLISGNNYSCTFDFANNILANDNLLLYSAFYKSITWSPFHGGEVSRMKLFSQFIINLRNNSMTECTVTFGANIYGTSANIDWISELVFLGWGLSPWGFFPWGQENTIDLEITTQPAPIVRTYVPPFEGRATFLQPAIVAHKAGEPLNIQSIAFVLRPYNERVSR